MRAREDVVRALRCTASTGDKDCTGCPYLLEETVPEDMAEALGSKLLLSCDTDQIELAAEAAVERDWISVEDRLPEEHESIFAKAYGTKRWADGMFRAISDEVLACVAFEDGHKVTMTLRTHDGAWGGM